MGMAAAPLKSARRSGWIGRHELLVRVVLVSTLCTAVTGPSAAAGRAYPTLEPVDEGVNHPEFNAFRTSLLQVIANRNTDSLLALVHASVRNGFGGDDGIDAFRRKWRPERADSEIWSELSEVLRLGGAFQGPDTFVAPYVYARWPERFDAFEHAALVGSGVRIRAAPDPGGPVLTTLTYAVVRLGNNSATPSGWTAVALEDGRPGFVASRLVRRSIDYRAFFVRTDGRWRVTALIAGD